MLHKGLFVKRQKTRAGKHGYVERVLLVVHTVREEGLGAIIRIVSARKATPAERKLYEESE